MCKINKIIRIISFIILGSVGTFQGLYAQQVSGTITDAQTGEALPGVNILVVGTSTGAVTDNKGQYSVSVPSLQDTLRFSFIGYQTQTVPIDGRTTIDIRLGSSVFSGQQLVVTGYTTTKKENLTGSVSVVNTKDLQIQTATTVTNQLQGLAPGVTVISSGQPGAQPMIHIRGFNSFGNNNPLYVVDGVPTQNIRNLSSSNIASMQVLKGAAASIYGSRASNGVILIKTKRGHKGKVKVNYNFQYGWQQPKQGNVFHILSPINQARLRWKAIENSGGNPRPDPLYGDEKEPQLPDYIAPVGAMDGDPSVKPNLYNVNPFYTDPTAPNNFYHITRANKKGTDWFHQIFHTEPRANSNLTISGGGDTGNYLLSLDYTNQLGTLLYTSLKRYGVRANTRFNVTKGIHVGENLSYTITHNPTAPTNTEGSAVGRAIVAQPIVPVYDIMGNFAGASTAEISGTQSTNPVALRYRTRNNKQETDRLFGNVFADIDFYKNFTFHMSFGGTLNSGYATSFTYPQYEGVTILTRNNSFHRSENRIVQWTWTNTLTFKRTFSGVHNLKILVGTEAFNNEGSTFSGTNTDYFSFDPNYTNLSTGTGTPTVSSSTVKNGLFSLIGQLSYNFKNKYIFNGTLRRDGTSKLLNNRYGWFPSVSAGWRISSEKFMKNIPWLSNLKMRGSYGILGNQFNVSPDNAFSLYAGSKISSYYDIKGTNNSVIPGFSQVRLGNPFATWEKDISTDIGVDVGLLSNKLQLTIDFYNKKVKDLLFNPPLLAPAGDVTAPFKNVGSMRDRGIDASIKSRGTIVGDLNYNASLSFTLIHNKIVKIAQGVDHFDLDTRRFSGSHIIRNAVGQPLSSFYGYKIIGFWNSQNEIKEADAKSSSGTYQTDAAVGRFRYKDINGDNQITPVDRTFLGDPNPNFTYGIHLGLNYKDIDFSVFFYGVNGNQIWNQVRWRTDFYASFRGAKSKTALFNSWTSQDHNAKAPIQETANTFSSNAVPSSYYVEDGAYFRAKNIVLGYTIPAKIVSKLHLQKLRIYGKVSNLFTITNYSGLTPSIGGSGVTDFGIDLGQYATPRQFLVGINLSF